MIPKGINNKKVVVKVKQVVAMINLTYVFVRSRRTVPDGLCCVSCVNTSQG